MKKIITFALVAMLAIPAIAKPGDCKKCTKKTCTAECKAKCTKTKCEGVCK